MKAEYYKATRNTLWITMFLNLVVVIFKITFGYMINSIAMIADGFHSLMDSSSNLIGLIGLKIASRPADKTHQYGHRKFETLTTIFISFMLFIVSFELVKTSMERFRSNDVPLLTFAAFLVLVGTLIVNLFVSKYEKNIGEKYGSEILIADSAHTRSDVWVTISVIIGFCFIHFGYPIADPILALFISLFIAYSGYKILKRGVNVLSDCTALDERNLKRLVLTITEFTGCHKIRTRRMGDEVFLDMHVMTKGSMTVIKAHTAVKKVERLLKREYPDLKDVTIHVDPNHKVKKP